MKNTKRKCIFYGLCGTLENQHYMLALNKLLKFKEKIPKTPAVNPITYDAKQQDGKSLIRETSGKERNLLCVTAGTAQNLLLETSETDNFS